MSSDDIQPIEALREALPSLRGGTLRLAQHLLRNPAAVARSSVTTIAQECGVAPSTLSRLAARLGYSGFPDLRGALATEHGRAMQASWERDIGAEVDIDDPSARLLDALAAQQHRAARASATSVDIAIAEKVATAIAGAGRVLLYGSWANRVPLEELRLRLLRLGIAVSLEADITAARYSADNLRDGDVLLILVRGSADDTAGELIGRAAARGAQTVLITGEPDSPGSARAQHVLATGVRSTTWTETFAGRASDTLVCSFLWLLVAQRLPDALGHVTTPLHDQEPHR